jgi:hypothetical protein
MPKKSRVMRAAAENFIQGDGSTREWVETLRRWEVKIDIVTVGYPTPADTRRGVKVWLAALTGQPGRRDPAGSYPTPCTAGSSDLQARSCTERID